MKEHIIKQCKDSESEDHPSSFFTREGATWDAHGKNP